MILTVLLLTVVSTCLAQPADNNAQQRPARAHQSQIQYKDPDGLRVDWKFYMPRIQGRSEVASGQRAQRAETGTAQANFVAQRQSHVVQAPAEPETHYQPYSAIPSHIKQLLAQSYAPQGPYVDPGAYLYQVNAPIVSPPATPIKVDQSAVSQTQVEHEYFNSAVTYRAQGHQPAQPQYVPQIGRVPGKVGGIKYKDNNKPSERTAQRLPYGAVIPAQPQPKPHYQPYKQIAQPQYGQYEKQASLAQPQYRQYDKQASLAQPQYGQYQKQASLAQPQYRQYEKQASLAQPQYGQYQKQASLAQPQYRQYDKQASLAQSQYGQYQKQASLAQPQYRQYDKQASLAQPQYGQYEKQASLAQPQYRQYEKQASLAQPQYRSASVTQAQPQYRQFKKQVSQAESQYQAFDKQASQPRLLQYKQYKAPGGIEAQPEVSVHTPTAIQQLLRYQAQLPYNVIANHILYRPKEPFVPKPLPESVKIGRQYPSKVYLVKTDGQIYESPDTPKDSAAEKRY